MEETKQALAEKENQPDISEEYEKKMAQLNEEIQQLQKQLNAVEKESLKPSPALLHLQRDMADLKVLTANGLLIVPEQ